MSNVYAIVMAGGSGTRFWPASRATRPKQLLPLGADPRESLIAATVRRLGPLVPPERVYIATGEALVEATAKELPGVPREHVLAEPVPRNTAPCIGWATATILRQDPDAVLAVLPADHAIADEEAFRAVLARALEGARRGLITTVGIVPTRPETGYGYIETAEEIAPGLSRVARFVEKPDRARAAEYLAGGRHLWNAGMFFFAGKTMRAAIEKHLPALAEGLARIEDGARRGEELGVLRSVFPTLPSISIDHGVMEKAGGLGVVKGDFGWNDVGSWESAWELAKHDAAGNALPPESVAIDARGNLVCDLTNGSKRLYALLGVSDLVLVETDDAVLVLPRARAQEVRAVVDALKARGDKRL